MALSYEFWSKIMSKIRFNYADRQLHFSPKSKLKALVNEVFIQEKKPMKCIQFVFCSDEFLLKVNQDFLQHDYYTDIITFPLSEKEEPIEAEIYISLERVRQNAKQLGVAFEHELVRVLAHGALHLCGYKDKSKSEIEKMRERENFYLERFLCST